MSDSEEIEYGEIYEHIWRDIVQRPDGTLDEDQVKRELYDYYNLILQAGEVYSHVTGGVLSKLNYTAGTVISAADEHQRQRSDWAIADVIEELLGLFEAEEFNREQIITTLRNERERRDR